MDTGGGIIFDAREVVDDGAEASVGAAAGAHGVIDAVETSSLGVPFVGDPSMTSDVAISYGTG